MKILLSGRVLGHLVSGHFRFWVVLGRVGSGIGSSSVGSFRVSGRIRSGRVSDYLISDHFESRVVSDRIGSDIELSSVESDRIANHIRSDSKSFSVKLFEILSHIELSVNGSDRFCRL
jgi:hypothetical protein